MHKLNLRVFLPLVVVLLACSACNYPSPATPPPEATAANAPEPSPGMPATPGPSRLLTICMGLEPGSLFLYGDESVTARGVRQAIYDGPYDVVGYKYLPVIMEKIPAAADGDVSITPVAVQAGSLFLDGNGKLVNLAEGNLYKPAGCKDSSCAVAYSGQDPVQMDQMTVRYKLRGGLQWSDGTPLTADDSRYSFEVASSLYPRAHPDVIAITQSYQALDDTTIEWKGVPGYQTAEIMENFFSPLPRHAWGNLKPEELLTADASSRRPMGWGPYTIDEWTAGDHISLSKNPNYFRKDEGLPFFDKLVYRFVPNRDEALAALLAGECDYLDETTGLESKNTQLQDLQKSGKVVVAYETGTAWEHIDFGIVPINAAAQPSLFQSKMTRQAIAMCIDRQGMADQLFFGQSAVPDSYVPSSHPLYNPDVKRYTFDPQAAGKLLDAAGWLDSDGNPSTPRVSKGVAGLADGTPLAFTFLTTNEEEKQSAAQLLKDSLAQCGIQVDVKSQPWEELFAPGPNGPVFGRIFAMTQFGWASSVEPPCFLYTTQEIPGPYPDYPKGWGGSNASGYSNPDFDKACRQALATLPDTPEHKAAHFQAQSIFAEDLPAIPLYLRLKLVAMRPDMCGVTLDPSADSALWNLEKFNYGEGCQK